MALGEYDASQFAQKLICAMAESGELKLRGSSATQSEDGSDDVGQRDAAYLSSLYRNLGSGLQK